MDKKVQYKIYMKAQYKDKIGDCIYIVDEREAFDLEALGYAVIIEKVETESTKLFVERSGKSVETAALRRSTTTYRKVKRK